MIVHKIHSDDVWVIDFTKIIKFLKLITSYQKNDLI